MSKTSFVVRIPVRQLAVFEIAVDAKTQSGAVKQALEALRDGNGDGEVLDEDAGNLSVAVKKTSMEAFENEPLKANIPSSIEVDED